MDFSSDQTWDEYDPQGLVKIRLEILRELIPQDVKSILDVGCGNGIVTNELAKDYTVTGIDPSAAALKHVRCAKIQASIIDIPMENSSFDLVCCNEVLEHLDPTELKQGIAELKRVSRKYLLISVPHREQLEMKQYLCSVCGHSAHVHGHLQSFDSTRLADLFSPEFYPLKQRTCGVPERRFPPFLLHWKHRLGQWFEPSPGLKCAKCGSSDFVNKSSIPTKFINLINLGITRPQRYWYMALYQRKGV